MPAIVFENVCKSYKSIRVLDNISFKIEKNESILILGANGSGKSTTIKLILDLIKLKKYDSGNIYKEKLKFGYVPEKVITPKITRVKDYLKDFYELKGSKFNYLEMAKYFDLDVEKRLNELSKGMRQKVGLILALDDENDMYILDEATNGLDDESINKLVKKLEEYKNNKKGIIIVSHYKDIYEQITERQIIFEASRIIEDKRI